MSTEVTLLATQVTKRHIALLATQLAIPGVQLDPVTEGGLVIMAGDGIARPYKSVRFQSRGIGAWPWLTVRDTVANWLHSDQVIWAGTNFEVTLSFVALAGAPAWTQPEIDAVVQACGTVGWRESYSQQ